MSMVISQTVNSLERVQTECSDSWHSTEEFGQSSDNVQNPVTRSLICNNDKVILEIVKTGYCFNLYNIFTAIRRKPMKSYPFF